jgi:hypothetical protein
MPDIPALVASLDTRLDELVTEISMLEAARAALRTRTLAAPPPAAAQSGATPKRPRRPAPQTTTAAPKPGPPVTDPRPELATTAATASTFEASTARRRASATTTPRKRVSSLSAEQLEQLLAGAGSGLSAGAIAEQAGVGYSRVLARLRELEASGESPADREPTLNPLAADHR